MEVTTVMKYNGDDIDFSKLIKVDENSDIGRLFKIIDDIDTAFDMFKPKLESFEHYILNKIKASKTIVVSDGYDIYLK